jgi:hypothetical protein
MSKARFTNVMKNVADFSNGGAGICPYTHSLRCVTIFPVIPYIVQKKSNLSSIHWTREGFPIVAWMSWPLIDVFCAPPALFVSDDLLDTPECADFPLGIVLILERPEYTDSVFAPRQIGRLESDALDELSWQLSTTDVVVLIFRASLFFKKRVVSKIAMFCTNTGYSFFWMYGSMSLSMHLLSAEMMQPLVITCSAHTAFMRVSVCSFWFRPLNLSG